MAIARIIGVTLLIAPTSWAVSAELPTPAMPGAGAMLSQVVSGLALVTAAIFILAWLVKRLHGGSLLRQENIKVTSSLALGTREKIALVVVENKKILLGVTSGNISCLHVFDGTEEEDISGTDVIETSLSPAGQDRRWDFSHYLKRLMKEGNQM